MKSLAEHLGVVDPRTPDVPAAPAPSSKITAKSFARDILNTVEYRDSLLRRILVDDLPPAVECMLWDRAHGKTIDKVEVRDTTNVLEDLSVEQLRERALFLAGVAEKLAQQQTPPAPPDDDDVEPESIH